MLTRSIDGSFIKLDLDFKSKLLRIENLLLLIFNQSKFLTIRPQQNGARCHRTVLNDLMDSRNTTRTRTYKTGLGELGDEPPMRTTCQRNGVGNVPWRPGTGPLMDIKLFLR